MKPQSLFAVFSSGLLFLSCAAVFLAQAAPGDLDLSFAGTGKSRLGFGLGTDFCRAAAVQPDGKLVLAGWSGQSWGGDFCVVRFDTNNVLDSSFGVGGKAHTPILSNNNGSGHANAVALQADGKIVLAGYVSYLAVENFALVRFNPDGSLDNSFGSGGIVITDFGDLSEGNAVAIQSDQKIIVAGSVGAASAIGSFALARYNTDGSLDASFGSGGKVITSANGVAAAYGVVLQSDGKIVAAGSGGGDFALVRYTATGLLDSTFGSGAGRVFTHLGYSGSRDTARAVAIQSATDLFDPSKIIVAGSFQDTSGHWMFGVIRYSLNGSLDTSFGNNGMVTRSFNPAGSGDLATALLVQTFYQRPTGSYVRKITVAGYGQFGTATCVDVAQYDGLGRLNQANLFVVGAEAYGLALQGDKIVFAGTMRVNGDNTDFCALRINSDGSFDNAFGVATVDIADGASEAAATAIQSDGKIIVAGGVNNGSQQVFALARYNADGSLDTSFGVQGKVTTALTAWDSLNSVDLQLDGKILAGGSSYDGTNNHFALVRYHPDGSLDASFGNNGKVITSFGTGQDYVKAVRVQPDGRIVAAGGATTSSRSVFGLARYNSDGSLDSSFGTAGKVTTSIAGVEDFAKALQIQKDGKIVAAGTAVIANSYDFALVRYNPNGSLDNSFGSFGRVATPLGTGSDDIARAIAIQPDGRIVLAGTSRDSSGRSSAALTRYLANGTLDPAFGQNGKVITQVGLTYDSADAVALQPDGRIVVAGTSTIGGTDQFAAIRYNADGSLDNSYGSGGKVIVDFGDGVEDAGYAIALDQIGRSVIVGAANTLFGIARLEGDPFLKILSIGKQPNGDILLQGLGSPGRSHTLLSSSSLTAGSFAPLNVITPDALGFWRYEDQIVSGISKRFYRLSLP